MILNPVRPLSAYRLQRDELDARTKQRKAMLQNVIDLDWYTSQRRRGAIKLVANKRRNAARLLARKQALLAIRAYRIEHGEDGGEEEENQSEAEENQSEAEENQSEAEEHQGDEEEDSNDEEEDARGERGPRCCRRACCDGYPPAVVATIRALMSRLPHTDQRHFMGRRVRQPVLRKQSSSAKGKIFVQFGDSGCDHRAGRVVVVQPKLSHHKNDCFRACRGGHAKSVCRVLRVGSRCEPQQAVPADNGSNGRTDCLTREALVW